MNRRERHEALKLAVAEWNEEGHPRDENGRFAGVSAKEASEHLEKTDSQYPSSEDAGDFDWQKGEVKLSEVNINPGVGAPVFADDPNLIEKVRKVYENPDTSLDHIDDMINGGAVLPPIVLTPDGKGFRIMDGYHRIIAESRRGNKSIKAYVATPR